MTFGDCELIPICDAFFRLDGGSMFGVVPKPLWERRAATDNRNRVTLATRVLVVRIAGRTVLIDAGIGEPMNPKDVDLYAIHRERTFDESLRREGVDRTDIDVALASHLHFDHVGGFTAHDADGRARPRFPRAEYVVRRGEWQDAINAHERSRASYSPDQFLPLEGAAPIRFMDADGDVVPGIRTVRTGGHTRHHTIAYIESKGQTAVFTSDLIPTAAHVDVPWIMAFDLFPMETLEFKRAFVREAIDREYLIFFVHDPSIAAGVIREKNGRPFVEPVAVAGRPAGV